MATNDVTIKPNLQQTQTSQPIASNVVEAKVVHVPAKESDAVTPLQQQQEAEKKQSPQESLEKLQEKVEQLNDHMQNLNRSLQFRVDELSGDTVVKVIDSETKELVRQIPSEEVLDVKHAIEKYKGILLEAKV
jgi:flagellar protein FlaG